MSLCGRWGKHVLRTMSVTNSTSLRNQHDSRGGSVPPLCKLPPLATPPPPRETVTSMFF